MPQLHCCLSFAFASLLTLVPLSSADAQSCTTTRVDLDSAGTEADLGAGSGTAAWNRNYLSANMRYLAFWSSATNLVVGDTNGRMDVFVRDRVTNTTTRVSVDSLSLESDGDSSEPALSADGRLVVFQSTSTNLVANDLNARTDVFLHDRSTGTTSRISVDSGGTEANHNSFRPDISADGLWIAYESRGTNLVAGDGNNVSDVFLYSVATGATTLVSSDSSGAIGNLASAAPALSANGRFIAFHSRASALVIGDFNNEYDVFVKDQLTGVTELVSVDVSGAHGNFFSQTPSISADGRYVAFSSVATNLIPSDLNNNFDVFWKDRLTGEVRLCSQSGAHTQGNAPSQGNSISADGRYVGFISSASNLVSGDNNGGLFFTLTDVFVHDVVSGATERASIDSFSTEGVNGSAFAICVARDGSGVAFYSGQTNLAPGDSNGQVDVFVRTCGGAQPPPTGYCFGTAALCPCGNGGAPGRGCDNSFSTGGAFLTGTGLASVSADTFRLSTSGLPPTSASVLFFQGDNQVAFGSGVVFGDGLRCAGGAVLRLGARFASGGVLVFGSGIGSDPLISVQGAVPPGTISIRYYQAWYRNVAAFCTSGAFNLSNGLRVVWIP